MSIQDDFGVVTRAAEMRARYGNRVCHGLARHIPTLPTVVVVPGDRPAVVRRPPPVVAPPPPPAIPITDKRAETRAAIARVLAVVAEVTGASIGEMQGASQAYRISRPRQLAYELLRSKAGASLKTIGLHLGGKDHTSVRAGVIKTRMRLASGDPQMLAWMTMCRERLRTIDVMHRD